MKPLSLHAAGRRLEAWWSGPGPEEAPTLVFLHDGLGSAGSFAAMARFLLSLKHGPGPVGPA